jgi:hypothetical protein
MVAGATSAPAASVQFNGNTYYIVNGNNPNLNTGNKVCASVGKQFLGYKSINTNGVCQVAHPTARTLVSVNGSKAGFYCNGAPQQGLACAAYKNTCEVCPNCNLNEAADGNQSITQHFAEMYVWCGTASSSSSSRMTGAYGVPTLPMRASSARSLSLPKSSSRFTLPTSSARFSLPTSSARFTIPGTSSAAATGKVSCTFSQKPLKKVTCAAYQAANTFCVIAMQSTKAYSTMCQENGSVVCVLPCSAPGSQNLKTCAYGGYKVGSCSK